MAVAYRAPVSLIEFEEFIERPENANRLFERIGGEIVEMPSNTLSSKIAMLIGAAIIIYLQQQNDIGHVTGEQGMYIFGDERYAPDVAFISYERQPQLPAEGFGPNPPELVVEVLSPTDRKRDVRIKTTNYLAFGTTVWIVDLEHGQIEVHAPGEPVKIARWGDTLTGGDILPGFELSVENVLSQAQNEGR